MQRLYTGNAYVFVPHIDRHGSLHGINVVHRGLDGLVEWRSGEDAALAGPSFRVDGADVPPGDVQWERLDAWVPRMEATLGPDLRVALTFCAPTGYEALARGILLHAEIRNRGTDAHDVEMSLGGTWHHALRCVATVRPLQSERRLVASPRGDGFALEVGEGAVGASLAVVLAGGEATLAAGTDAPAEARPGSELRAAGADPLAWRISRAFRLESRRRTALTFAVAAGLERDGALHTAARLAALDAERIIQEARIEATRLGRHTLRGHGDRMRDNFLFAAYAGVARAIDDDRIYPVASRILEHGACAVVDEADVLLGTLPALCMTEPFIARELLMRMFELYSDRAGTHLRYIAGGVLAPGFSLTRYCAYAQALDTYVRETRDATIVDEPLVQDILREMDEWLWGRLDRDVFLCSTDLGPSGQAPDYPFTVTDNVRAWRFAKCIAAHWRPRDGEPPARFETAADDFASAIWKHGVVVHDGSRVFAGSVDLDGNAAIYDDPEGSLRWLPHLGFCDADDPVWTDTMDLLHSAAYPLWRKGERADGIAGRDTRGAASFSALCAELASPRRSHALDTLGALTTPGGIACRLYDADTGACVDGAWSATRAGLLAWTLLQMRAEPAPRKR